MQTTPTKPKLVFFQFEYDERLPQFLLIHKREHVKCLSQFFDVTVIDKDCDYREICERYEPELALFESGVPFPSCKRPRIINTQAVPHIPKVGLLHADAFCCGRTGFLSDMEHWGIETFFSIATTARDHIPALAAKLFIWPVFVDSDVFRDYEQPKVTPVLFTGNTSALYPWRRQITQRISKYYPAQICRHPGYAPHKGATKVPVGEDYARMLNASWFVPACGTVAKELIRKHLEVPATYACLITEESPALRAAGFADMVNCVFADERDVLDKLDYLFRNEDRLRTIIAAGHQLVHCSHTLKHRGQIYEWFTLHRRLQPNQRIVQTSPFEPLQIVESSQARTSARAQSGGLHLALLRQGDEHLWAGRYVEAEVLYRRCASYISWMPEPKLKLTLCLLYKGNPERALSSILDSIQFTLVEYKAKDPDPVEWAYYIVSLLCLGRIRRAIRRAQDFAWLHHPELDRIRFLTALLSPAALSKITLEKSAYQRASVHQLPNRTFDDWFQQCCFMLRACGQPKLAEIAKERYHQYAHFNQQQVVGVRRDDCGDREIRSVSIIWFLRRRLFYSKSQQRAKCAIRDILHWFEKKIGYFLPHRFSSSRTDEFFKAVEEFAADEQNATILIVGAALSSRTTQACFTGALRNANRPAIFCVATSGYKLLDLVPRVFAHYPFANWYRPSLPSGGRAAIDLSETVQTIKKQNSSCPFDVILINGSAIRGGFDGNRALEDAISNTRCVLLNQISSAGVGQIYRRLLEGPDFFVRDHKPTSRNGFAIFEKNRTQAVRIVSPTSFTESFLIEQVV